MVQSNGTRPDSHLLRMDFTGSRKYSGRSPDLRRVAAAGEIEARRAMPTSGAARSDAAPGTASVAASAATKTAPFRKSCTLRSGSPQEAGMADGGQSEPPLFGMLSGTMLPGPWSRARSLVRVFGL